MSVFQSILRPTFASSTKNLTHPALRSRNTATSADSFRVRVVWFSDYEGYENGEFSFMFRPVCANSLFLSAQFTFVLSSGQTKVFAVVGYIPQMFTSCKTPDQVRTTDM